MKDLVLGAAAAYFWDNPVFIKEVRLRFRSKLVYFMQAGYLAFVGIALFVLLEYAYLLGQTGSRASLWAIGQATFRLIYSLHGLLLTVMLCAMASGGITSEREARLGLCRAEDRSG